MKPAPSNRSADFEKLVEDCGVFYSSLSQRIDALKPSKKRLQGPEFQGFQRQLVTLVQNAKSLGLTIGDIATSAGINPEEARPLLEGTHYTRIAFADILMCSSAYHIACWAAAKHAKGLGDVKKQDELPALLQRAGQEIGAQASQGATAAGALPSAETAKRNAYAKIDAVLDAMLMWGRTDLQPRRRAQEIIIIRYGYKGPQVVPNIS